MLLFKSTYHIEKMDCPSEKQMVRLKIEPLESVLGLSFDIPQRTVHVIHQGNAELITEAIAELGLGSRFEASEKVEKYAGEEQITQKQILWWVLGINASFFVIEMGFGLLSNSMGLIADSLDMLADTIVYGLSLIAVGTAVTTKKKVAKTSGLFQMLLALIGFSEVVRRFFFSEAMPDFRTMIAVASLAMVANVICLWLIQKASSEEAHMQASAIFTSNDIIVNGGVIVAGLLVYSLDSPWPDLIVGGIVFGFVMRGAMRILKLSK
ncbi:MULTISPECIES: cation transporter [Cerasicoccaceae]|uniref:cation transporter n=1 Tax=Cerasicoccaceae TaxID=3056374 RepID=UPI001C72C722|nr:MULTISPECIES: cation transporter [Cerasicoccaceae]QYY35476.1 cation transporter [Ruficoccus sp. ZRK36]